MFRIKICGVTCGDDARAVAQAGADAIGLNFFPGSARWIDRATALEIARQIPVGVAKVGVFVNAEIRDCIETHDQVALDAIQLHGDEPPEYLQELGSRRVIRAFRCGEEGMAPVLQYLADCQRLGCLPDMVLMDAFRPGHYGGTGETINWMTLIGHRQNQQLPPLVLAGGLRPETVAHAIEVVQPAAVDTASGVESSPGHKDRARVEAFVSAAREAFDRIGQANARHDA